MKVDYIIVNPFIEKKRTKEIWIYLQEKCIHSYFTSWGWIGTFLDCLPEEQSIEFVWGEIEGKPVICFLLGRRNGLSSKFIYSHRAYLNATGYEDFDRITIEYNGVLLDTEILSSSSSFLETDILKEIDQFIFPYASLEHKDYLLKDVLPLIQDINEVPSFFVDLDLIRNNDLDYFSLLSKNRRAQIRKTIKEYEKLGKLEIVVAGTVEEALTMLEELACLHQKEWNRRNKPGAFSVDFFIKFNRKLIENRFDFNEIQLIKVNSGVSTIGYLYSFIYQNEILFYQCGFNYLQYNNYRPGMISHYLSILFNAESGYDKYDFLAGSSAYKKSLSTSHRNMYQIRLRRKKLRFYVEDTLRFVKDKIKQVDWLD